MCPGKPTAGPASKAFPVVLVHSRAAAPPLPLGSGRREARRVRGRWTLPARLYLLARPRIASLARSTPDQVRGRLSPSGRGDSPQATNARGDQTNTGRHAGSWPVAAKYGCPLPSSLRGGKPETADVGGYIVAGQQRTIIDAELKCVGHLSSRRATTRIQRFFATCLKGCQNVSYGGG